MARRDFFHDAVKRALEKDEWVITHDPLSINAGGIEVMIDLGAESLIAAERQGEKIAVEVKSFVRPSAISEFHMAVGQYVNYRQALWMEDAERLLFLAVPADSYETFFMLPFVRKSIADLQFRLIVYDPGKEVIVKWVRQASIET